MIPDAGPVPLTRRLENELHACEFPLSTVAVARLSGASYRQIDWWCRQGWIPGMPAGTLRAPGRPPWIRAWTKEQTRRALELAAAARLKKMNVPTLADELARLCDVE